MNEWQLCPKCNGNGYYFMPVCGGLTDCDLCNGTRIISRQTGLPPDQTMVISYENRDVPPEDLFNTQEDYD